MTETGSVSKAFALSAVANKPGRHSHSTRNGLLCALAVAAAVLVADPFANSPFIDDFSYAKTALNFARTGHFIYNGYAVEILGWLVPWGALFIKIFGFSFNTMRWSMLPLDLAAVFLFHQILRRFGVNPANAVLGTLALGLSPVFLPLAASFMTDIPGLLVILVCIYMCQRAAAATGDRAALLWLCSAMLVNVAGGTVRQIAWLGALIMVPSTAWLLRERRGMKTAGVLLFLLSLLGVLTCIHWFNRQPYSVPEHAYQGPIHPGMLVHLSAQLLKAGIALLRISFPVLVVWLLVMRRFPHKVKLRIALAMTGAALLGLFLHVREYGHPLWAGLGTSLLVLAPIVVLIEYRTGRERHLPERPFQSALSWKELKWILGPFSLCYVLLLLPRGTYSVLYTRYVLDLAPIAIVIFLRIYQEQITAKLPAVSVVILAVFALYGIANSHDFFAESRAIVSSTEMIEDSGVPRTSIRTDIFSQGFTDDGWAQIENGGHINDPRIRVPVGAYRSHLPSSKIPVECRPWYTQLTPAIVPRYFVVLEPMPCFVPTRYRPIYFRSWLPPFDRVVYVQQLQRSAR